MPLAEVAGLPEPQHLSQRRPHAVSTDRHVGVHDAEAFDLELDRVGVLVHPGQRGAFVHLGAGIASTIQEQRVELGATDDGRVDPRPRGSGSSTTRPDGDRTHAASTGCHDGKRSGDTPSCSSNRSAPVVSPSPQHLSRGNVALSISATWAPAFAKVIAAALPAGPAPTTATSTSVTDTATR